MNKPLSITQATRQARKHVDALMPGVMATVDSNLTADPVTLESLVRTVITFPDLDSNGPALYAALTTLPGIHGEVCYDRTRVTITRTR